MQQRPPEQFTRFGQRCSQSAQERQQVVHTVVQYLDSAAPEHSIWNVLLTKWERLCTVCPLRLYCPCAYTDLSEKRPYCLLLAAHGREGVQG
ncbi:MAG TPA: hypothetical protein VFB60_10255 [Ktedonobacteraceae bacterium]|nr:hypothetical protein [Ktedonobacteraceae bacterium]